MFGELDSKVFKRGNGSNEGIFYAVYGIFSQNQRITSTIAKRMASNTESLSKDTLYSVLSIMRGRVTAAEVAAVADQLERTGAEPPGRATTELCLDLLAGLDGDMTRTARFVEKIRGEDSHIASLLVGPHFQ